MNAVLMCVALAATSVFRLELVDEQPYIVGADGVKRAVCIVDPVQYAVMTGQTAKVWASLNAQEDSRARLHGGRAVRKDVVGNDLVMTYPDGFVWTEKGTRKTAETMRKIRGGQKSTGRPAVPRRPMSDRQRKFLEELHRRKDMKPKEITVIHDANTGKDTVVK